MISHLFNVEKLFLSKIAIKLNRNKSTISREIKRNTINGVYNFSSTHQKYKSRQWHKHIFYLEKYFDFTECFKKWFDKRYHDLKATTNKIKTNLSNIKIPSFKQVYNWIKSGRLVIKPIDKLCSKKKIKTEKELLVFLVNLRIDLYFYIIKTKTYRSRTWIKALWNRFYT